jgi:DcaP outer membrane protein
MAMAPQIVRHATSTLALVACIGFGARPALAEQGTPEAASVEELRRLFVEQKRLLEEQGREIADLRRKLDETSTLVLASRNELAELREKPPAPSVPAAVEERLARMEQDVHRFPELVDQTVTAGEFPGSIHIPGSDAALRVGGLVRMLSVNSYDAIGTGDRFIASSIPVAEREAARDDQRTTYSAAPSRFNLDLRTPTGVGAMRAFIEGDFAASGPGNLFQLRHAYGQWRKLTVGQTWSTFSDPEAEPNGIDREGLNAISLFRQAQFRWTHPFGERLTLALAAENPAPDISAPNGSPVPGVNQVPDLVTRLRWTPGEKTLVHGLGDWRRDRLRGGHVQLAFLLRQVRGEFDPNATLATLGAGFHYSGRITSPLRPARDRILFALAGGWGIGRYINDLGNLGQDAVYDPATNTLQALPILSGYVGYEHWWIPTLRSTATWGTVYVDNLDVQTGDALHRTDRATLNLSWSPIPRIDIVGEFLWGRRLNKDGRRGEARQLQIGTTFRF